MRVALLGASGFIGRAVADALISQGHTVLTPRAPRLATSARTVEELLRDVRAYVSDSDLASQLIGSRVVVNAAGLPDSDGSDLDQLIGANALLPAVALAAASRAAPDVMRFVHISSAVVQGRAPRLDASRTYAPFSPYSLSKAIGEQLLESMEAGGIELVMLRPTSVHGASRGTTQALARLARSPLSSVSRGACDSTPQVLVENVAAAVCHLATCDSAPPRLVVQPAEGLTAETLLITLGGHRPMRLPNVVCRWVLTIGYGLAARTALPAGAVRRLEMLWYGQDQARGWLEESGWKPAGMASTWQALADVLASENERSAHWRHRFHRGLP